MSKRADTWLGERLVGVVGRQPDDQVVAVHTDGHVPVGQERQPTEHPLLAHPGSVTYPIADPLGESVVEGHAGHRRLIISSYGVTFRGPVRRWRDDQVGGLAVVNAPSGSIGGRSG
jgi:hypothetical protein